MPSPATADGASAALEALAACFDRRRYATVLVRGQGRVPRLIVTSRYAHLACDVYAGHGWYWSGEPAKIAPTSCPAMAARDLTQHLGRVMADALSPALDRPVGCGGAGDGAATG